MSDDKHDDNKKEPKRSRKKGAERNKRILNKLEVNPSMTQLELMAEFGLSRRQVQNAAFVYLLNSFSPSTYVAPTLLLS